MLRCERGDTVIFSRLLVAQHSNAALWPSGDGGASALVSASEDDNLIARLSESRYSFGLSRALPMASADLGEARGKLLMRVIMRIN